MTANEPSVEDLSQRVAASADVAAAKAVAAWVSLLSWVRVGGLLPVDGRSLYIFVKAVELTYLDNLRKHGISERDIAVADDAAWDLAEQVIAGSASGETSEDIAGAIMARIRQDLAARKGASP